jgi:hypothetical protein
MSLRLICNVCGKSDQCHHFPQQRSGGSVGHRGSENISTSKFDETDIFYTATCDAYMDHTHRLFDTFYWEQN